LREGKLEDARSDFDQALLRFPYDMEAYVYRVLTTLEWDTE
jgi:hypothetical protein